MLALPICTRTLEHWMAHLDQTVRHTRRTLQTLANPTPEPDTLDLPCALSMTTADVPDGGHGDDRAHTASEIAPEQPAL